MNSPIIEGKVLIDTGPSSRGWQQQVKHDLERIVGTGAISQPELVAIVRQLYAKGAHTPLRPPRTRRIPLSRGLWALVDEEDFERFAQFQWFAQPMPRGRFTAARKDGNRTIQMHRELLRTPARVLVDHINGDALDNRKANLRTATTSQNGANAGKRSTNTSGFKGVSWDAKRRKWLATIRVNYKTQYLGRFDDKHEAARAYDTAAVKHFGKFARLNFPKETQP